MSYLQSAAGSSNPTLTLTVAGKTGPLAVPYLQDVTINNANDVFTWSQLNESAKLQVATTSTNSISTNIVVDPLTFFGNANVSTAGAASKLGIIGLSKEKTLVGFTINMGNVATGGGGRTVSGNGYVTGIAPTVSADSPVWVTPLTLTVDGEYDISVAA
jgi:hypothetical protein